MLKFQKLPAWLKSGIFFLLGYVGITVLLTLILGFGAGGDDPFLMGPYVTSFPAEYLLYLLYSMVSEILNTEVYIIQIIAEFTFWPAIFYFILGVLFTPILKKVKFIL